MVTIFSAQEGSERANSSSISFRIALAFAGPLRNPRQTVPLEPILKPSLETYRTVWYVSDLSSRGKSVWLETGLNLLASEGPSGLTVERLCQATRKTRGSFYHHFSGIKDFVRQVMEAWRQTHTQDLIDSTANLPPRDSLQKLRELARRLPFDRENAFRTWAARDPEVAGVVKEVDSARVGHLMAVYQAMGQEADKAESLAWIEYALLIGLAQVKGSLTQERRRKVTDLFERSIPR